MQMEIPRELVQAIRFVWIKYFWFHALAVVVSVVSSSLLIRLIVSKSVAPMLAFILVPSCAALSAGASVVFFLRTTRNLESGDGEASAEPDDTVAMPEKQPRKPD